MHYFKDVIFFKKYLDEGKEYVVTQLCRKLTLLKLGPSDLLFKKGEAAKHYFIVVRGCVNIYLNKDRYLGEARLDSEIMSPDELKRGLLAYCERVYQKYGGIDLMRYAGDPFFFDQVTLDFKHHLALSCSDGTSFGELGLMRNAPRAGTAITNCSTYLATLDAESFRKILHFEQHLKIDKKMKVFKESMLGDMEYNDQVKIAYYFKKKYLKKNDIIYNQGDQVGAIYIVRSGVVELRVKSQIDLLGLDKFEKDPNLKLVLEKNAKTIYGLQNTTSIIQKVAELGEKVLLNDWTELDKEHGIPHQMYTAIASTEVLVLYECTYRNYLWIRDNYPELAKSLAKKSKIKNKARYQQLLKANHIRTEQEKASKGINPKNTGVRLFTIETDHTEYTHMDDRDKQQFRGQSIKQEMQAIDDMVRAKSIVASNIKDDIGESIDEMVKCKYEQYKRRGIADSARAMARQKKRIRYGAFKEDLGYKTFVKKFKEFSDRAGGSRGGLSSVRMGSEEGSVDGRKGRSLITSVELKSKRLPGLNLMNNKISNKNKLNKSLDAVRVARRSVDFLRESIDVNDIPEMTISIYNCSMDLPQQSKSQNKQSSNNVSTRVPGSSLKARIQIERFSKTVDSTFTYNEWPKKHIYNSDEAIAEVSFAKKNTKNKKNCSDLIYQTIQNPLSKKRTTLTKQSKTKDLHVLASKRPFQAKLNPLLRKHIISQNNLLSRTYTINRPSNISNSKQSTFYGHLTDPEKTDIISHRTMRLKCLNVTSAVNLIPADIE